jgi:outer membrane protein OmpA-like peptidoglycan-associated protein
VSKWDSVWQSPSPSSNIHPTKLITAIGFLNQGNLLLYSSTWFDKGLYRGELWVGVYNQNESSVTNHRKLDVPYFKNVSPHQSGALSKDGRHIILSMESTVSYGVEDLYVIHLLPDGTWSSPKNLGYRVNTAFQEYTPFLAPDNKTLFFASNGRGGEGSFDIFVTQRIDNTWQNWTEPVNLGPEINSAGAETSFSFINGDEYAYFCSTQDSEGYGDLKRIRIKAAIEEKPGADTITLQLARTVAHDLMIEVRNKKDSALINASLSFSEDLNPQQIAKVGPRFFLGDLTDEDFTLSFSADRFLTKEVVITSTEAEKDTLSIYLDPLEVGTTIQLENILFYRGTPNIIEGSEKELYQVAAMLKENPDMKIELHGHTDAQGDAQLNQELSEERVRVVKEILVAEGIDAGRISGKGYGSSQPVAPNDTEANRKLNRRVEFTILEN